MIEPFMHKVLTKHVDFDAINRGEKHFFIGLDTYGFQKGDLVRFYRMPECDFFTGRLGDPSPPDSLNQVLRRISWVQSSHHDGLLKGYVVLSLESY